MQGAMADAMGSMMARMMGFGLFGGVLVIVLLVAIAVRPLRQAPD